MSDPAASAPLVLVALRERATTPAGDRALLVDAVAEATGVAPTEVEVTQWCARCGGDHGRPILVRCGERGTDGIDLSLSRAGRSVAIAVSFAGPVGIDIESVAAASRSGFDDVAFGRAELDRLATDGSPALRTVMWTAKEAVLKATGHGLRVDPREIEVSLADRMPDDSAHPADPAHPDDSAHPADPTIVAWSSAPVPLRSFRLSAFDSGPGLVGTVAVIADVRPEIRMLTPAAHT